MKTDERQVIKINKIEF